jgi:hypothetical protein
MRTRPSRTFWYTLLFGVMLIGAGFLHLWKLAELPRGIYVDEASIGINAAAIAQHGKDEHGFFLPIYFQAFGEYKNPLYIYLTALLFKVGGVSVFLLRLGGVISAAVFALGVFFLTRRRYPHSREVWLYAVTIALTLPWFFSLSRIAFEVITQLAIMIWVLWGVQKVYESPQKKQPLVWGGFVRVLAGLSVYAYSTGRVLSILFLFSLFWVYRSRVFWQRNLATLTGFALSVIPYALYSMHHAGALTERFKLLSYIYNPNFSLLHKAGLFVLDYLSYFSPAFLFSHGDLNPRHHIGVGGEMYPAVILCVVFGLYVIVRDIKKQPPDRFTQLLLWGLLFAPVAAALTEPYHSLRSVLVGLYLFLLSINGFSQLWKGAYIGQLALRVLLIMSLIWSMFGYFLSYFITYPAVSAWAFESYDFQGALQQGVAQHPDAIIISMYANQPYAHLQFYEEALGIPETAAIRIGPPIAQKNRCIITFAIERQITNPNNLTPIYVYGDNNYVTLTCY